MLVFQLENNFLTRKERQAEISILKRALLAEQKPSHPNWLAYQLYCPLQVQGLALYAVKYSNSKSNVGNKLNELEMEKPQVQKEKHAKRETTRQILLKKTEAHVVLTNLGAFRKISRNQKGAKFTDKTSGDSPKSSGLLYKLKVLFNTKQFGLLTCFNLILHLQLIWYKKKLPEMWQYWRWCDCVVVEDIPSQFNMFITADLPSVKYGIIPSKDYSHMV